MKNNLLNFLSILAIAFVSGCGQSTDSDSEQTKAALNQNNTDYLGALGQAQKVAAKTVDVANLQQAINMFQAAEDGYPKTLQEVVDKGYIPALPELPSGFQYNYDATSGRVKAIRKN